MLLDSVYFCDNDAYYGSAIYTRAGSSGNMGVVNITITDATISNSNYGRSIYNNIDVTNSTIHYDVTNSILWTNGPEVYNTGGQVDANFAYCIIEGSGASTTWDQTIGVDGGNNSDSDPQLVIDGCNDGLLNNTSPAIGTGASGENIGYYQGVGITPFTFTANVANSNYCSGTSGDGFFNITVTDENLSSVTVTYTSSDNTIIDPNDFLITTTNGVSTVNYFVGSGLGSATINISVMNSLFQTDGTSFIVYNNETPVIDSIVSVPVSDMDTTIV